jgi:hypothetical protein
MRARVTTTHDGERVFSQSEIQAIADTLGDADMASPGRKSATS